MWSQQHAERSTNSGPPGFVCAGASGPLSESSARPWSTFRSFLPHPPSLTRRGLRVCPSTAASRARIVIASPLFLPEPYMCRGTFHALANPPRGIPLRCPTCRARQLPALMLARSPIHGFGVFSSGTVMPNEVLVRCEGAWSPAAEIDPSDESLRHPDDATLAWRSEQPDWLTFINHSAQPNCIVGVGDGDTPFLQAGSRRIQPWSELTVDYGATYEWPEGVF